MKGVFNILAIKRSVKNSSIFKKKFLAILLINLSIASTHSQSIHFKSGTYIQNDIQDSCKSKTDLRGYIKDKNTGKALPNAIIYINYLRNVKEHSADSFCLRVRKLVLLTDSVGNYSFININTGIYSILIKCIGYKSKIIENLLLNPNKKCIFDIYLEPLEKVTTSDSCYKDFLISLLIGRWGSLKGDDTFTISRMDFGYPMVSPDISKEIIQVQPIYKIENNILYCRSAGTETFYPIFSIKLKKNNSPVLTRIKVNTKSGAKKYVKSP